MGFSGQFAMQQSWTVHVRLGSKADIAASPTNVRFTPKSGPWNSAVKCPLCAKSGHCFWTNSRNPGAAACRLCGSFATARDSFALNRHHLSTPWMLGSTLPLRPKGESRLANWRKPKGLPSASATGNGQADRTPRGSLLAFMTASREQSKSGPWADREAMVCFASRRFFLRNWCCPRCNTTTKWTTPASDRYKSRWAMSKEDLKAELEQLRKENAALRKEFASGIRLKVSEKGAVSVYGLRRSPVTLDKQQWLKLLDRSSDIRAFIAANKAQLKAKDRWLTIPRTKHQCSLYPQIAH